MLRLTILLLLLANAAYFAWSQGLLAPWGIAPAQQSEPQRVGQQVNPKSLRILSGEEARRLEVSGTANRAQECLQAGLIEDGQLTALRQLLQAWPPGSWQLEPVIEPAHWIVYLGKYANAESVSLKMAELRQIGVSAEALSEPSLEPGLSLGGFATEAAATKQMAALSQRGVRSAKVVQERPETRGQLLKLPAVDDNQRARLDELRPALGGKSLRPCGDRAAAR